MIGPVVAGVDGWPEGFAAADWAAREALRRGLSLRLVHAWESGAAGGRPEAALPELRAPQYRARHVLSKRAARRRPLLSGRGGRRRPPRAGAGRSRRRALPA
ncbi:hypothetical protein GCM10022233_58930 [Streptomyces shaanxiensis]|uniref:UspA domain-containing protein n=2 Tax=Streptomyces shaanxiensis TaxID=653357 RepID=A0ABP7VU60_9ACTN